MRAYGGGATIKWKLLRFLMWICMCMSCLTHKTHPNTDPDKVNPLTPTALRGSRPLGAFPGAQRDLEVEYHPPSAKRYWPFSAAASNLYAGCSLTDLVAFLRLVVPVGVWKMDVAARLLHHPLDVVATFSDDV